MKLFYHSDEADELVNNRKRLRRDEYYRLHNFVRYAEAAEVLCESQPPELVVKIRNTISYFARVFKEVFYVRVRDGKLLFLRVGVPQDEWRTWMTRYDKSVDFRSRVLWNSVPKRFVEWDEDDYYFSFYQGELLWYLEKIAPRLRDTDFVINHRDQVCVPDENGNPTPHLLRTPDESLKYATPLLPVFSLCGRSDFRDLLFMNPDDIYRVASTRFGIVFPSRGHKAFVEPNPSVPWKDRISKIVFRGRPTGFGEVRNIRIQAYKYFGRNPNFDIGLTAKMPAHRRYYYQGEKLPAPKNSHPVAPNVAFETFAKYKFILYMDGNVAAYRLATLFSTGCLVFILKQEFSLWCDEYLKHQYNCVYAETFAELDELVSYYLIHEDEARLIARRGLETHQQYFTSHIFDWGVRAINAVC